MKLGKLGKILSWAIGAVIVSSTVWAATLWYVDSYGNIKIGRSTVLLAAGQTSNCKLNITGTTLSVVGSNGSALSANNPCLVGLNNGSVATFTTSPSVTFGAASDTDGNLFGISDVNYASAKPMILGVITDGTTSYFTLGAVPSPYSGAAAADMCQKNDTDCDAQVDKMLLTTGATLANWTSKQITNIAWITGTYASAGAAWTFTLSGYPTGFNREFAKYWWVYPPLHHGATVGHMAVGGGGTVPQYSTDTVLWMMTEHGRIFIDWNTQGDGGNEGNGANSLVCYVPIDLDSVPQGWSHGLHSRNNVTYYTIVVYQAGANALVLTNATTGLSVTATDQNNTTRYILGSFSYQAKL